MLSISKIIKISAMEILDSRGIPTVQVEVITENGGYGKAMIPSGSSVGTKEASELRDGDNSRYFGKGVLKAVHNINEIIAEDIVGMNVFEQALIDSTMIKRDGSDNKSTLGANAILGVSLAVSKAAANDLRLELFEY
jgi:enolase